MYNNADTFINASQYYKSSDDYYLRAGMQKQGSPHKKIPLKTNKDRLASSLEHQKQATAAIIKPSELKFKMESVGNHPEEDDDLDMCPSRTRPCWPKKITPWWVPSSLNEKPPYSYATLIAHAILSNKNGRLTLNDIYTWIADNYSVFSLDERGWQNSIRHNLSLNKKWFCKIDRRPTQANPGKGCYWTLVVGTEEMFMDNLTYVGGHNRKHKDIGFRTDLSVGQRKGVYYYKNNVSSKTDTGNKMDSPAAIFASPQRRMSDRSSSTESVGLITPPSTPTKASSFSLFTHFKLVNMTEKQDHYTQQSAVGVGCKVDDIEVKICKKRRRSSTSSTSTVESTKRRSISPSTTLASSLTRNQHSIQPALTNKSPISTSYPSMRSISSSSYSNVHLSTDSYILNKADNQNYGNHQDARSIPTTIEPSALIMKNQEQTLLDLYGEETSDHGYTLFECEENDSKYYSNSMPLSIINNNPMSYCNYFNSNDFAAMMPTMQSSIYTTTNSNNHSISPPLSPNYLLYPSASYMQDTFYL